ncbi:hypothetical protein N865_06035 [Intrasporangium oryzae NRRL B-24470]|uniref:CHAT domain-containing protein n=1 Tax=Intrasporangium oryzae NRRL B-24470 TaxID=1386089 RepID=W9G864_9MICO|nr:CHAT domain-containing protein [Intrasporangium oryzae]EWT02401.1 hypothetical protein N865_06035 [Intrasporangium oryzae NRRL B-24470]
MATVDVRPAANPGDRPPAAGAAANGSANAAANGAASGAAVTDAGATAAGSTTSTTPSAAPAATASPTPTPTPTATAASTAAGAPEEADDDEDPGRPRTTVHVAHGDLRFARHHVLVGHYPGSTIAGGEAALDQLLDGRLSRAALLGIYPGAIETCQVFTDPNEWSSPPGAVVAGLGPVGMLSAASLARAVAHAALTAALGHLSITPTPDPGATPSPSKNGASAPTSSPGPDRTVSDILQMRLSSLLIGTGAGGLPVRDSVQALLTGIQRANDRLSDTGMPVHIADVEIIELWQDRALQALEAVRASLTSSEIEESFEWDARLRELPGRQRRLLFQEATGWWQQVRVHSDPDGALVFDASVRRAGAPTRTVPTQRALVDRLVESLVDTPSPDDSASRTLFELLFPNDLKAQAPDTDNIVLVVDRGSAHYPWELLDDHASDTGRAPLGVRRGLIRQLEGSSMRSHVLSATTSRALVVGDTASGLTPLPAAQQEGREVSAALQANGFDANSLIGATGTQVIQALFDGSYRVVHLAGHGVYQWPLPAPRSPMPYAAEPAGAPATDGAPAGSAVAPAVAPTLVTGMVLGGGMYLTAGEIGQMRQVPELVVVNCCHLGTVAADASDPSAPPRSGNFHRLAASFATELIEIGVRGVVACGWAVDDGAASTFASSLYAALLDGEPFGEAVSKARTATWEQHPDVNTWGAYQCYGDPDFRLARDGARPVKQESRAPACLDVARVEIENLGQSVDVSRDTKYGLERLQRILDTIDPCDRDDDTMQALLARTYTKFGSFDTAREIFEQSLRRGGGALTVRDFEVWIDQRVRTATAVASAAGAGPQVEEAVATIEASIELLRGLLLDPALLVLHQHSDLPTVLPEPDALPETVSSDRLWLVASAYKRLALVTCPTRIGAKGSARSWARTKAALVSTARWYEAARQAAGPTNRRRHGALGNRLGAELCLRWHQGTNHLDGLALLSKAEARALLAESLRGAREEAYLAPSFWSVAVYGDLLALDALFSAHPEPSTLPKVLDLYRRASELGSEEQLQQVRDQVAFLAVMAGTAVPERASFLEALAEGLTRIDEGAKAGQAVDP